MTLTEADRYKKFVEKARAMQRQRKSRPLAMTGGLADFLGHFAEIAGSLELTGATKAHIIGMSACMSNLKASESALGLFSDPFIDIAEMLGREIASLTLKNGSVSQEKTIQWWLEASILVGVGMLALGQDKKPSKDQEILDPAFRDELLLSLFFHSGYPRIAFKAMAVALEIPENKEKLFVSLYELIMMIFTLVAYSSEKETIRPDLGESLRDKLQLNIAAIKEGIENVTIKAYLELAEIALNKGDIDQLAFSLQDLLKTAGYTSELLQKDISATKDLFKRFKIAYYASQENTMNMVHMLG